MIISTNISIGNKGSGNGTGTWDGMEGTYRHFPANFDPHDGWPQKAYDPFLVMGGRYIYQLSANFYI